MNDTDLEQLANWASHDAAGALDFLRHTWVTTYGSASDALTAGEAEVVRAEKGERFLRLATGGWSENEALIGALQQNRMVWLLTWVLHARGGLYIFRYPGRE
jgi:hypothetical protein